MGVATFFCWFFMLYFCGWFESNVLCKSFGFEQDHSIVICHFTVLYLKCTVSVNRTSSSFVFAPLPQLCTDILITGIYSNLPLRIHSIFHSEFAPTNPPSRRGQHRRPCWKPTLRWHGQSSCASRHTPACPLVRISCRYPRERCLRFPGRRSRPQAQIEPIANVRNLAARRP